MKSHMQKLFTGLQPSGILHVGNYFGALQQTVELLKDSEGLVMLADYHALTSLKNAGELRTNIMDLVKDYIAVGIDPSKDIIFKTIRRARAYRACVDLRLSGHGAVSDAGALI